MGSHTEASLTSLVVWNDESRTLKDLAGSKSALPGLYKIVRGHYRNVGSDRGHQRIVSVHSVESSQKILAENVKISGSKTTRSDQKYSVPLSFQGWFEVLSEDGKSISTLSSVKDIAKALPHYCLVREDFKAPISDAGVDNKVTVDKTRIVRAGEKLTLRNDILAAVKTPKGPVNKRYLRCHDEQGRNVFLSFDEDISLSPIAGQNNISGVHSVRGLLDRFRLPVTVRLAHGVVSAKLDKNWSSIFRLINTYSEEVAYVLPVKKDAAMLAIPIRESLQFVGAKNVDEVKDTAEFHLHVEKCSGLIKAFRNSIQVISSLPDPESLMRKKNTVRSKGAPKTGSDGDDIDEDEEELLFEEIEEIYRYVRDGGDPPPPKTRPSGTKTENHNDTKADYIEPTSNYAYINDLKKVSPAAAATVASTEKDASNSHTAGEIIEDYMDEPLYADIAAIQKRKRQNGKGYDENQSDSKVEENSDTTTLPQPLKASADGKVTLRPGDRVNGFASGLVAPAAEMVPVPVAAVAAVALTSENNRTENIQSSPAPILRSKKPGPPTAPRLSQVIRQSSVTVLESASTQPMEDKAKLSNAINNNLGNDIIAEKPDENCRVSKLTSLFKQKEIPEKVEEKKVPTDLNSSTAVANSAKNAMFTNNAKGSTKPEIQQKSVVDPLKITPSTGMHAVMKEKETEIRNSTKLPPPVSAAISRDFQINKSLDMKKELGFVDPIKPVIAQPVRSANNLMKPEVARTTAPVENKVKEFRRDISENVPKDFSKATSKVENTRKDVVKRIYEPVSNDKTRVTNSRMEAVASDIANNVAPAAPLLTDFSNNKRRKSFDTPAIENPSQGVKKEITSQVNRVPNIPQIPIDQRNSFVPVSNIQKEVSRQDVPLTSNSHKSPDVGGTSPQRINVSNVPPPISNSLPPLKENDFGQINQDLNVVPQSAFVSHSSPTAVVDYPPQSQVANYSSSPLQVDRLNPPQSPRITSDLSAPNQSITIVEPQPQSYQHTSRRTSKDISPTMVKIGESIPDSGNVPVGWRDDEPMTQQTAARPGDGPGSTAVNISNGIAAPIERSVLQLSSSKNFNQIESSVVHTSGFDKLMQDEDINRRNMLHMDTQTPGKTYLPVNTESRSPIGYTPQPSTSSSAASTGITVYPDRTVLSVSSATSSGYNSAGYATIKSSGTASSGIASGGSFGGTSTINRMNTDTTNGVSITTVRMDSGKTPDQGYRVSEYKPAPSQPGPGSGHTVLRISQQTGSSGASGTQARSGTTYAVNVATLRRVK